MKKLFIILYLLTNIFVLGACGDVESEGDPQPRVPRVEVESDDYYVQITQENMDGVAFVYRWLDIETASKYVRPFLTLKIWNGRRAAKTYICSFFVLRCLLLT